MKFGFHLEWDENEPFLNSAICHRNQLIDNAGNIWNRCYCPSSRNVSIDKWIICQKLLKQS